MSELKSLHRRRGGFKRRLTALQSIYDSMLNIKNKGEFNKEASDIILSHLSSSDDLLKAFNNLQDQIEDICDETQLDTEYKERDDFVKLYHITVCKLNRMHLDFNDQGETNKIATSVSHELSPTANNLDAIKLPIINLPKFNGAYTEWLEFKEVFESLIHTNKNISDVQKFHYLRASLGGCALKVIQKPNLTGSSYQIVWDNLCNRYSNSDMLIHEHIKAIFELPHTTSGDSKGFRNISDDLNRHLRYLAKLGDHEQQRDALLVYIISNKLDKVSLKDWEEFAKQNKGSTLENFDNFLTEKAEICEKLEQRSNKPQTISNIRSSRQTYVTTELTCYLCKANHAIYHCSEFLKLSVPQKYEKIKTLHLCSNCLKQGHSNSNCRSSHCRKCSKFHNTLLHVDKEKTQALMSGQTFNNKSQVLLSTVSLTVFDVNGQGHTCRALLDSGSQSHFMTYSFFEKLQLPRLDSNISIIGVGNSLSNIEHRCKINIASKHTSFKSTIECFLIARISDNIPSETLDLSHIQMPNIQMADDTFDQAGPVDLLIGAEIFWNILRTTERISLGKGNPSLQNTAFGWILTGMFNTHNNSISYCNLSKLTNIQEQLQQFWQIEECSNSQGAFSIDEQQCESHFQNTVTRTAQGRFMVTIPFKISPNTLGDSAQNALKRFYNLEKRLVSDEKLKDQYNNFMNEYENLGHMTKVSQHEDDTMCYYLPHHPILKENSLTTRCRVVFDGSAATDNGLSLNDCQYVGPVVQQDLISILIRFRQHAYVFTADISKMYRQIQVIPEQRKLQKIFWRSEPEHELQVYELNTITYGTTSAPFLATRCIKQLAIDNSKAYPLASQIIERDFYIDDLISGTDSVEQAKLLCNEISVILASGCFELRKWCSNNPEILETFKNSDHLTHYLNLGENSETKLLGLQWSFIADTLTYHINNTPTTNTVTKRSILSEVAKTFDPLGLLSPSIMLIKFILQQLWSLKIGWDDDVPENLKSKWEIFRSNLHVFNSLSIPRFVFHKNTISIELHGYCDASQNGYGACIYARCIDEQNNVHVTLFCAKGKVAPLRVLSIPRLELCGALLLARLMYKVTSSITCKAECFYWSDSQLVLSWLNGQSRYFQVFVANRIAEIQRLTNLDNWHYVNTNHNPADIISRGIQPNELVNASLWWNGPPWLSQQREHWPNIAFTTIPEEELPERKKSLQVYHVKHLDEFLINKFSCFDKLKRITAYIIRFKNNCKLKSENRQLGRLTVNELTIAFETLIKITQGSLFSDELSALTSNKNLLPKNKLKGLTPFLDSRGIIRVGGRIENSNLSFDQKHPILLSAKSQLSTLIFNHEHVKLHHGGPQLLLYTVRQNFWVIGGRNLAKKIVRNCIICYRANPKIINPLMGNLPSHRIQPIYPFIKTGTDYAGPFLVKEKKGRGQKLFKCYICLFVCMTSKAVHLEAVTDLTSNSFIAVLRRFIARRGQPTDIFSDNGKTYVGAHSELKELGKFIQNNNHELSERIASQGITWHFIPAYSPNFGGLWESGIKSTKHHLKRVVANSHLTLEQFITLLTDVEGILNSRPLSPMSSDPHDFQPLTPSHFLIGRTVTSIMEPDIRHVQSNRVSMYQHVEQMKQHFWARWHREYIGELQNRQKWKTNIDNIKLNTLVLIQDENLPPLRWKLGRIVQLHPGSDNIVRVVSIQTRSGIIKRAVAKICPLPNEPEN